MRTDSETVNAACEVMYCAVRVVKSQGDGVASVLVGPPSEGFHLTWSPEEALEEVADAVTHLRSVISWDFAVESF